jgi:bis(5'-nucleosyl)-tetraphosphatase (symmetrical)
VTTWAIGDLQGCYDALQRLLEAIRFDPARDRLWFCGDLVNRGGQSLETLRLVHSLDIHSVVVLGNHDLSLLSIAERKEEEQRRVNPDLQRILFAEDRQLLLDWLRARPLLHRDASIGWAVTHAGLAPKWNLATAQNRAGEVERVLQGKGYGKLLRAMYGDRPQWSPKLTGLERQRAIINVFTRMRYCSAQGRIAFEHKGAPGTQPAGLYPWYEVPGSKPLEQRVVFGHWSTLGLFIGHGVHGIDTGCVWGGRLTALELVAEGEPPRIVQVPGRQMAAGESKKED